MPGTQQLISFVETMLWRFTSSFPLILEVHFMHKHSSLSFFFSSFLPQAVFFVLSSIDWHNHKTNSDVRGLLAAHANVCQRVQWGARWDTLLQFQTAKRSLTCTVRRTHRPPHVFGPHPGQFRCSVLSPKVNVRLTSEGQDSPLDVRLRNTPTDKY